MGLVVTDHIADGAVGHQNFKGRQDPVVLGGNQLLGNHDLEDHGQLGPNLILLVLGEYIDDPVDGVGCPGSMEGGNHQMTGFCSSHGCPDGLVIPEFSQEDDIRGLPKSRPESRSIILRIGQDLPLGHDAFLMTVEILDGILQGDDMGVPAFIDPVDDAGQSGAFSTACRPSDQSQPAFQARYSQHLLGNADSFRIRQFKMNHPDNGSDGTPLFKDTGPETGQGSD